MGDDVRVAVVTGASSGIGKEAAKTLAAQGWRVIAIGRDPARSAAAERELQAAASGPPATMLVADLAILADVDRTADQIAGLTDRVDVLLNNAGGMAREQATTSEGLEANFAGNHLGPFRLTDRLLPLLRRAAAASPAGAVRIVNTSSDASEMIPDLNWADLQLSDNWSSGGAYCGGKLANVLHAKGLADRLAGDGIVAHAVHPGTIGSNFASHASEQTQAYMATLESMTPEKGSEALVWLATADEAGCSTGGYWHQKNAHAPNPIADDKTKVDRLWQESEKLVERVIG